MTHHHYRETHARGRTSSRGRRPAGSVEAKLANFVKAIAMGIMNDARAQAKDPMQEQKKAEWVKATLREDQASIRTSYQRIARHDGCPRPRNCSSTTSSTRFSSEPRR